MNRRIILHGYCSENATVGLRSPFEDAGFDVFEVNEHSTATQLSDAFRLAREGCVILTSCHFFCRGTGFRSIYPTLKAAVTPLDFNDIRHPGTRMVFLAHDLAEPIKEEEWALVGIFDKVFLPRPICMPFPIRNVTERYVWFKDFSAPKSHGNRKWVFLPTDVFFELRDLGLPGYLERYKEIIQAGVPWKLAAWPGVEMLERELKGIGCEVLESHASARDVIASTRCVVTNTVGSIVWETIQLKKPCFLYKEQYLDTLHLSQMLAGVCGVAVLGTLGEIPVHEYAAGAVVGESCAEADAARLVVQEIAKLH